MYIRFLNDDTFTVSNRHDANIKNNTSGKNGWPNWILPTEELYLLAKTITKYIRFLSPDIIQSIVIKNEEIKEALSYKLKLKGVDPDLYLWEKSSCCFPGVRRYAGSSEISAYKKHSEIDKIKDAIAIDDNDYPKQIWSFIFRAAKYSKKGPEGYSLAHLVDHKKNWLTAGTRSLMGIVQWVPAFFIAKYIILYIESSSGKVDLFLVIFRKLKFNDSIALVV